MIIFISAGYFFFYFLPLKVLTRSNLLQETTIKVENQIVLSASKGGDRQKKKNKYIIVKPIHSLLFSESKIIE